MKIVVVAALVGACAGGVSPANEPARKPVANGARKPMPAIDAGRLIAWCAIPAGISPDLVAEEREDAITNAAMSAEWLDVTEFWAQHPGHGTMSLEEAAAATRAVLAKHGIDGCLYVDELVALRVEVGRHAREARAVVEASLAEKVGGKKDLTAFRITAKGTRTDAHGTKTTMKMVRTLRMADVDHLQTMLWREDRVTDDATVSRVFGYHDLWTSTWNATFDATKVRKLSDLEDALLTYDLYTEPDAILSFALSTGVIYGRPDETVDGKDQSVVRLWWRGLDRPEASAMVYIDKTTKHVTRIVRTVEDQVTTTDLGDYRKVGGRMIPFRRTITEPDGVIELVVQKAELDLKDVDPEAFFKPE